MKGKHLPKTPARDAKHRSPQDILEPDRLIERKTVRWTDDKINFLIDLRETRPRLGYKDMVREFNKTFPDTPVGLSEIRGVMSQRVLRKRPDLRKFAPRNGFVEPEVSLSAAPGLTDQKDLVVHAIFKIMRLATQMNDPNVDGAEAKDRLESLFFNLKQGMDNLSYEVWLRVVKNATNHKNLALLEGLLDKGERIRPIVLSAIETLKQEGINET